MQFEVTVDEANLIVTALAELPFKLSAALIQKLQAQGKAQLEQPKEPHCPNGGESQESHGHDGATC